MGLTPLRSAVDAWTPGRGVAADPLYRIVSSWSQIVGPNVAANTEPIALNGTTLLVATRSSAWSQQLQLLSPAILGAIAALPQIPEVRRLAFRSGGLRKAGKRQGPTARQNASRPGRPSSKELDAPIGPAADVNEAFERLRRRIDAVRRASAGTCAGCGAPVADERAEDLCAPCAGDAECTRTVAIQRLLYMAPWFGHADLREHFPDLSGSEYERVRRTLLARWWTILERAKFAGAASRSGDERGIASSYVLLQSRLPPDRVTPAVVANLLGDELVRLLWPNADARTKARPGRKAPFVE